MSFKHMLDHKQDVVLSSQGMNRLQRGSVWIPITGLLQKPAVISVGIVRLFSPRKQFVGEALYDEKSPHTLRCLGVGLEPMCLTPSFFYDRLSSALKARRMLWGEQISFDTGAYRLVHGEADGLPGLIIDIYARCAVVQLYNRFMNECLPDILEALKRVLQIEQIILRNDGSARQLDGLERFSSVFEGKSDTLVSFTIGKMTFKANVLTDRKTGFFLDQQANYHRVSMLRKEFDFTTQPNAIDLFSYHGGFALSLAKAGFLVEAGDLDATAVQRAKDNALQNQLDIQFQVWDAFEKLRQLESKGARYDLIILDPPALAKRAPSIKHTPSAIKTAYRAYKEINLRAMRLLKPGGMLFTFSCSAGMTLELFEQMLAEASLDAKRMMVRLERLGPGFDHPAYLAQMETDYLKGALLRAVDIS